MKEFWKTINIMFDQMSAKNKNAILTNKNKDMFRTGIKHKYFELLR
jgi:hypothetical protein